MMRLQSGVTGVNIINPQALGSCMLCAYNHQVVNIFLLVGVFHTCKTTQEICVKYCYLGTSERS